MIPLRSDGRRSSSAGWTLIEVALATCFVSGLALAAGAAATTVIQLTAAARAEAAGVNAAASKLEEMLALPAAERLPGNDVVQSGEFEVTRIWRIVSDEPAAGLSRIEVSAHWERPSIMGIVLVGVAP